MSAFASACRIEAQGMKDLIPFIRDRSMQGQLVVTDKGNLSKFLQKVVGDVIMNTPDGNVVGIELKVEKDYTGNLFLETWSNRQRFTVGWMHNLNTDYLFYYFLSNGHLFICSFAALRGWAFIGNNTDGHSAHLYKYREVRQKKYDQLNDTWGRLVPIVDLQKAIKLKKFDLHGPEGAMEQEMPKPDWCNECMRPANDCSSSCPRRRSGQQ